MSKRPVSVYDPEEVGRHVTVSIGRLTVGYIIERDKEAHAYVPNGGFVGTFEDVRAAREFLVSGVSQ